MRDHIPFLFVLMLALFVPVAFADASERWVLPINERNWQTIKVPGVSENQFVARDQVLQVKSNDSVSFHYVKLPKAIKRPETLRWSWRVDRHSGVATQRTPGRDDRPLAVHVWFDDDAEASLFGRFASVFGYPKVGHLITYVWGADETVGSILQNPHYEKGKLIIVVGSDGETGRWSTVQRDIAKDYKRAFGEEPDLSDLRYIAVSADSDDLDGHSIGAVRALSFGSSTELASKANKDD